MRRSKDTWNEEAKKIVGLTGCFTATKSQRRHQYRHQTGKP